MFSFNEPSPNQKIYEASARQTKQVRFELEPPNTTKQLKSITEHTPSVTNLSTVSRKPQPKLLGFPTPSTNVEACIDSSTPAVPIIPAKLSPKLHKTVHQTPPKLRVRPASNKKPVYLLRSTKPPASKMRARKPIEKSPSLFPNLLPLPSIDPADGVAATPITVRKLGDYSTSLPRLVVGECEAEEKRAVAEAEPPELGQLTGALTRWRSDRKVIRAKSYWTEVYTLGLDTSGSSSTTWGSSFSFCAAAGTSSTTLSASSLRSSASTKTETVRAQLLNRSDGAGTRIIERMPDVTTLLRASRDADEDLLLAVLKEIEENGITRAALNEVDCSGRTALSYVCSSNLTNILDAFLQIPGLDINKPDREGNGPLHFAAQAGQSDIINILLTRSRSIEIDAKNILGFTPLMKAALQGRTRCAKLLLFAGASPQQTDNGRKFRAEQWARFCGRNACAEMIEKCAKVRILEQPGPVPEIAKDKRQITRTLTSPMPLPASKITTTSPGNGIRSKLRKVFTFSLKESSSSHKNKSQLAKKHELDFYASDDIKVHDTHLSKGYTIPFEVPKLHVTPVSFTHNKPALIDPVTDSANHVQNISKAPALPPRSRIRSSH